MRTLLRTQDESYKAIYVIKKVLLLASTAVSVAAFVNIFVTGVG